MTKDLLEKMIKRAEDNGWEGFKSFWKATPHYYTLGNDLPTKPKLQYLVNEGLWKLLLFDKGFVEAFCGKAFILEPPIPEYEYHTSIAIHYIWQGKENEFFERWV